MNAGVSSEVVKTPMGNVVIFEKSPGRLAEKSSTGFFGMPMVCSPYKIGDRELRIIFDGKIHIFKHENFGFVLTETRELPHRPEGPIDARDQVNSEIVTATLPSFANTELRALEKISQRGNIGFQLGLTDELYWIGKTEIQKRTPEGWKVYWNYPNRLASWFKSGWSSIVVLPENRLAIIGGPEFFIQVIEINENEKSDKIAFTVSYASLNCTEFSFYGYVSRQATQYCINNDFLYFHIKKSGHIFRMRLDSGSITDYDVPWMSKVFTPEKEPLKWKNNSGTDMSRPIVPETVVFSPSPDGSVTGLAVMYNMPAAVMQEFELGQEGSTLRTTTLMEEDLPDPIRLKNEGGELIPVSKFKIRTKDVKQIAQ